MWLNILQFIIMPILLVVITGIGWLYRHEKEKRLQIEKQLSEKKYNVYSSFMNVYFELLKNVKKGKKFNVETYIGRMLDIKRDLTMYANDGTLRSFFKWEETSEKPEALINVTNILIEIRKDMVNPKTTITAEDFLKSLLREEYEDLVKDQNQP